MKVLTSFLRDESGQGLAEYAVLIPLVTVGLLLVLTPFREAIVKIFLKVVDVIGGALSG